jgi:hypothetical protein
MSNDLADKILKDETNAPGWKTTELWLTAITGLVNTILASTAPTPTTTALIICLTIAAVVYLLCRTVFKIAKLKYRPDEVVNFALRAYSSDPSNPSGQDS